MCLATSSTFHWSAGKPYWFSFKGWGEINLAGRNNVRRGKHEHFDSDRPHRAATSRNGSDCVKRVQPENWVPSNSVQRLEVDALVGDYHAARLANKRGVVAHKHIEQHFLSKAVQKAGVVKLGLLSTPPRPLLHQHTSCVRPLVILC